MKIEYISEDYFMIYLNKFYLKEAHFESKIDLELYFKSFFLTLKKHYGIKMDGFYTIDVYRDSFYGMILKVKKEDFDYFDIDMIDMKLRIRDVVFLYALEDEIFSRKLLEVGNIYSYNEHMYYKPNKEMSNILLGQLEEYTTIVFDTEEILEKAKKIDSKIILNLAML